MRYCANLGHLQDDESGLVYMRARYYEPSTGRFVSEDVGAGGWNWYSYCQNDPINYCDRDGHYKYRTNLFGALGVIAGAMTLNLFLCAVAFAYFGEKAAATKCIQAAAAFAAVAFSLGTTGIDEGAKAANTVLRCIMNSAVLSGICALIASGMEEGQRKGMIEGMVTDLCVMYSLEILGYLVANFEGLDTR